MLERSTEINGPERRFIGYSLHIELPNDEALNLEEWLEAVAETDGARPAGQEGHQAVNPLTGEAMKILGAEGDVEVFDSHESAWHPVLHWNDERGRASMNSRALPIIGGELVGPVGEVVRALAMGLGAQIRGDEGERYAL